VDDEKGMAASRRTTGATSTRGWAQRDTLLAQQRHEAGRGAGTPQVVGHWLASAVDAILCVVFLSVDVGDEDTGSSERLDGRPGWRIIATLPRVSSRLRHHPSVGSGGGFDVAPAGDEVDGVWRRHTRVKRLEIRWEKRGTSGYS
jgi:hypothetical protein